MALTSFSEASTSFKVRSELCWRYSTVFCILLSQLIGWFSKMDSRPTLWEDLSPVLSAVDPRWTLEETQCLASCETINWPVLLCPLCRFTFAWGAALILLLLERKLSRWKKNSPQWGWWDDGAGCQSSLLTLHSRSSTRQSPEEPDAV